MLDPGPVLGHREHPGTSFTALVGYDTLFSPKIEHEVGKFNHKTAQNETPVGNGLCVGSIFLIISLTELPALICAKKRHSPSLEKLTDHFGMLADGSIAIKLNQTPFTGYYFTPIV